MAFSTYILYSERVDRYYIGSTGNLVERLHRHNSARSKATKSGIPWKVVYTENFETRPQAYQREMEIKRKKSRKYIEALISLAG